VDLGRAFGEPDREREDGVKLPRAFDGQDETTLPKRTERAGTRVSSPSRPRTM
jgi:hypothetical protein